MPTIEINKQRLHTKLCKECNKEFQPRSGPHIFCSEVCKGKHKYTTKRVTTEGQYLKVSNSWKEYLRRLTYKTGRENITVDDLIELIEKQDYICALSGQKMTCSLNKGTISLTNASLDRINPGKEYSKENIRLVCRIANTMKWSLSDEDLYIWCRRILNASEQKP